MANLVVVSEVRKIARSHGKRLGKDFVAYLNRKVHDIVESNCRSLGTYKTLNSLDANAKETAGALQR